MRDVFYLMSRVHAPSLIAVQKTRRGLSATWQRFTLTKTCLWKLKIFNYELLQKMREYMAQIMHPAWSYSTRWVSCTPIKAGSMNQKAYF